MVGRLLKYDLKGYFRVLIPLYLAVLGTGILNRIVQFFETSTTAYAIVFRSSVVLVVLACIVCLLFTLAYVIITFYRNLFTREGYLSFTLPVSVNDHLHAKMAGALIVCALSVVAVLVSACIAASGEMVAEVVKAGNYLLNKAAGLLGAGNLWGWGIEGFVLLIMGTLAGVLFFYLCICIGQLAKKNRILAAFGVFFAFYVAFQILATIGLIVVNVDYDWYSNLVDWYQDMGTGGVHFLLCCGIALSTIVALVCYLIDRHIMTAKLNLE